VIALIMEAKTAQAAAECQPFVGIQQIVVEG
jgi:hypothetical protein